MPDLPPDPDANGYVSDSSDNADPRLVPSSPPGTPRWVYIFGIIALLILLSVIALHLAGGGFRGHMP